VAGKPRLPTGARTREFEWDAVLPSPMSSQMRTARNMNQPLIGAPQWGQPVHLCNHMGILRYQRMKGTSPSRGCGGSASRHQPAMMKFSTFINTNRRGSPCLL
jgi:hypothetical protein